MYTLHQLFQILEITLQLPSCHKKPQGLGGFLKLQHAWQVAAHHPVLLLSVMFVLQAVSVLVLASDQNAAACTVVQLLLGKGPRFNRLPKTN